MGTQVKEENVVLLLSFQGQEEDNISRKVTKRRGLLRWVLKDE